MIICISNEEDEVIRLSGTILNKTMKTGREIFRKKTLRLNRARK